MRPANGHSKCRRRYLPIAFCELETTGIEPATPSFQRLVRCFSQLECLHAFLFYSQWLTKFRVLVLRLLCNPGVQLTGTRSVSIGTDSGFRLHF
jgi:hypothetical protein